MPVCAATSFFRSPTRSSSLHLTRIYQGTASDLSEFPTYRGSEPGGGAFEHGRMPASGDPSAGPGRISCAGEPLHASPRRVCKPSRTRRTSYILATTRTFLPSRSLSTSSIIVPIFLPFSYEQQLAHPRGVLVGTTPLISSKTFPFAALSHSEASWGKPGRTSRRTRRRPRRCPRKMCSFLRTRGRPRTYPAHHTTYTRP